MGKDHAERGKTVNVDDLEGFRYTVAGPNSGWCGTIFKSLDRAKARLNAPLAIGHRSDWKLYMVTNEGRIEYPAVHSPRIYYELVEYDESTPTHEGEEGEDDASAA